MVASARRKLLGRARKAVFHCTARCVRRAFLCGLDPTSGEDYSHRRDWIVNREKQLAQLFTIEVEFRAESSNHLHVVLRTRPEIAARLRPREVARRWLTICYLRMYWPGWPSSYRVRLRMSPASSQRYTSCQGAGSARRGST